MSLDEQHVKRALAQARRENILGRILIGLIIAVFVAVMIWAIVQDNGSGGTDSVDPGRAPSGQPCFAGDPGSC